MRGNNTTTRAKTWIQLSYLSFAILLAPLLGDHALGQTASDQESDYLRSWLVLGPVVAHKGSDKPDWAELKTSLFDTDLLDSVGGEADVDPEAGEVAGKYGQWTLFDSSDDAIDLSEAMERKSWAVAYAAATIRREQASTVVLGIRSDDAVKVWVNGDLVHANWVARPLGFDDDLVTVKLRKGDNRLLMKVMNEQRDWAFSVRVLTRDHLADLLVKAAVLHDEKRITDLLAAGADVNDRNNHGMTPYLAARMRGHDNIAQMMQDLGANTEVEFDAGKLVESILGAVASKEKPGLAVLISKGGETLYSRGFGAASIEHDVPVSVDTKFRIGSVSKQFTAAAILKLQEQGKLSVKDTLSKFIEGFPRGDEVTLHHLLTHTSGLKNFTSKPDFFDTVASHVDAADMVESFKGDEFEFDPGEKFEYCNTGYFLLSYIVEQVSGLSFNEYLETTFFQDLGMHDTGVHESTLVYLHEATGYAMEGNRVKKAINWDMSRAGGAGNIYSTVNDLQIWNQAVFHGKVLSDESLTAAHTVNEAEADRLQMPYGYGWVIDRHRGLRRIGHSGGLQGFVSQLNYYPEHDVTVVALHNAFPSIPALGPGPICDTIAEAFLWRKMQSRPKYILATDVDPNTYDDYVGRYDYSAAVLTVTRDADKLMAHLSGQPQHQIYPSGDDKFFWKVVDAQVEFIRDAKGHVNSARHHQGIAKFVAPRIEKRNAVQLPKEILDRYVGKYRFKGTGEMTVRRQGNQLFAKIAGQRETKLFAESETELFWRIVKAEIRFVLDDDGNILEATFHQGGREIRVEKIE